MQILHAIEKSGHTTKNPKLRGIAIAPLLCRLYDIIIDERFCAWYKPNYEQAGFRPRQGCLLQIFMMFVLIYYSKEYNKDLYMGLMDYTKAFDYTNTAKLVSNLMEKGCGKLFVQAIAKMFNKSTYHPKLSGNRIGNGIISNYGVTQGRRSSGNFFSFYNPDMPESIKKCDTNDFMDPHSLAQLADDTGFYTESISSLRKKFESISEYSSKKFQIPNLEKTKFLSFFFIAIE